MPVARLAAHHSMISSAQARINGRTVRPSALLMGIGSLRSSAHADLVEMTKEIPRVLVDAIRSRAVELFPAVAAREKADAERAGAAPPKDPTRCPRSPPRRRHRLRVDCWRRWRGPDRASHG